MKRLLVAVIGVAVALAFSLPALAQDAAKGEQVFAAQNCKMCHAIKGVGNKAHPLDGVGAKLKADQIKEWITTPKVAAEKAKSTAKPPMKAYDKLSKADLDALVAYIESLK